MYICTQLRYIHPQTINNDWFACLLDQSELKFSKNRKISTHILLEKDNAT